MIDLTNDDKNSLVPETKKATLSSKQVWFRYRNKAVNKVRELDNATTAKLLGYILLVLVKIYWEMRKPKR